jgi:hypothetical protein
VFRTLCRFDLFCQALVRLIMAPLPVGYGNGLAVRSPLHDIGQTVVTNLSESGLDVDG